MIKHLQELLSIESVANHGENGTPYGAGPAKALEYMLTLCEQLGFRTKNAEGRYGYAEIGEGKEIIGVLGHLDVVPAGSGWDYPPFGGTVDNGRLYGRGALDDKGPMLISVYAAHDLAREYAEKGKTMNKRIRLIFGQTEENGDWYDMDAYVAEEEKVSYGFTPDGDFPAIYCEKGILVMDWVLPRNGSGLRSGEGGIAPNVVPDSCSVVTEDGAAYETTGKTGHGAAPWNGVNAITAMMKLLAEKNIPVAKAYMALMGEDVYGEALGVACASAASGRLSVNAGMLRVENDTVRFTVDIRYPEDQDADALVETIRRAVAAYGFEIPPVHPMRPVYLDKKGTVMQQLLKAYRDETGDLSEPLAIGGGTYARAMDHIIAFGPNFPGEENREHQGNEYITLNNMERLRRIYREALRNLLEMA